MYDESHYWYACATREKCRDKLRRMDARRRISFLGCCLQHALNKIAASILPSQGRNFRAHHKVINGIKSAIAGRLGQANLRRLADDAEQLVLKAAGDDADHLLEPPSAELLLFACLYAATSESSGDPVEAAFNALDKASSAVLSAVCGKGPPDQTNPQYQTFVDFQFRLLNALSKRKTTPRSFNDVFATLD